MLKLGLGVPEKECLALVSEKMWGEVIFENLI